MVHRSAQRYDEILFPRVYVFFDRFSCFEKYQRFRTYHCPCINTYHEKCGEAKTRFHYLTMACTLFISTAGLNRSLLKAYLSLPESDSDSHIVDGRPMSLKGLNPEFRRIRFVFEKFEHYNADREISIRFHGCTPFV